MSESAPLVSLDVSIEAWQRHNEALVRLLRLIPEGGLSARATESSPTVAQMFTHMHHERMVSVQEEAPEIEPAVPEREWDPLEDAAAIERLLLESAAAVANAVRSRVAAGRAFDRSFAHPVTMLHFLTFHEGYHHGQIKLALKIAGLGLPDSVVGPSIWSYWRQRE